MSIESTGRSRDEKKRASAPASDPDDDLTLYTRRQVAELLGKRSIAYVKRLEALGLLRGIRPAGRHKPTAMVMFRRKQVLALIEEAAADAS